MSANELRRVAVMSRVAAGTLKLGSAAKLLGLSYRQAKRIYRRYRAEGAKGLQHRSVGRSSNRHVDPVLRARVLALVREKYSGPIDQRFGPTLAAEHLAAEDGLHVDHETLRRWMLSTGLWSRARKRSPHRVRRERKAHFGELVQLDGSFHDWFEGRGPRSCLLTLVDDATGQSGGQFSAQETIWAAVAVLRAWIDVHGVPLALYTDWKNVYVRQPTEAERLAGTTPVTQFGRMCAQLGIRIIAAGSPQAKGRIERQHGTHQDRLVKKLRRRGIADLAAANTFLGAEYWTAHNARFARPPASPENFHLPVPRGLSLANVFRLEQTRTVSNDWVVRYDNRYFQLARQSHRPPARATVQVYEAADGQIEIRYRERIVRCDEIAADALQARRSHRVAASQPSGPSPERPRGQYRPPVDHPWRRMMHREAQRHLARRAARAAAPVEAAGAVDAQCASTAPWKTTEPFSTAPTGDSRSR